jgi:hypothetical protein
MILRGHAAQHPPLVRQNSLLSPPKREVTGIADCFRMELLKHNHRPRGPVTLPAIHALWRDKAFADLGTGLVLGLGVFAATFDRYHPNFAFRHGRVSLISSAFDGLSIQEGL